MRRYLNLVAVCAVFLLTVSISASAGSIDSFSGTLSGVANGTVSGTFALDTTTGQFSNVYLSFSGAGLGSGNVDPGSVMGHKGLNGQWSFLWWGTSSNGDFVLYDVKLLANGTFVATGGVTDWHGDNGGFNLMVPEGGTPLTYLMLSMLAMAAGIVISRKQRCGLRTHESN
jgi:hypothetical protein